MVIFSLSPLRARKSDNYRYRDSWKSDNFRERQPSKKKQRTDTKKDAKGLKLITLQGAIGKEKLMIGW